MKFEIKSILGEVLFTAEIETNEETSFSIKMGLAVRAAYLRGANLRGAYLKDANLHGANLRGAYLEGANLEGANLEGAYLCGAYLEDVNFEDANLRGAYLCGANLEIPKIENIHQTVYDAVKQDGALDMSSWHSECGTSHCRAGWVNTLAGEKGKKLEDQVGTASAAYLIYRKSDDSAYVLDFYADNDVAMAEMKRMAEIEACQSVETTPNCLT